MNLIWMIELKTIKFFTKKSRKNNKKSKEKGSNWNHYYNCKNKNYKLDLKDKIESHKTLTNKKKNIK